MRKGKRISPDALYKEALKGLGDSPKPAEIKLLKSGLTMLKEKQEAVCPNELFAITSLITYKAYEGKVSENTVTSILQAHYDIEEVEDLPARLYQNAVEFLIDLEIDKVLN